MYEAGDYSLVTRPTRALARFYNLFAFVGHKTNKICRLLSPLWSQDQRGLYILDKQPDFYKTYYRVFWTILFFRIVEKSFKILELKL